eukprot:5147057-Amphidinium_carterae.1
MWHHVRTHIKRSAEDEAKRAEESRMKYETRRELFERLCIEARRKGVELKVQQLLNTSKRTACLTMPRSTILCTSSTTAQLTPCKPKGF